MVVRCSRSDIVISDLPAAWSPMNGEPMKRVPLSPGATEYDEVLKKFRTSAPSFSSVQKVISD